MIIIESDNNFFTKCDIKYHNSIKKDNGLRYKINFIIIDKNSHDKYFRTLLLLKKLDRVYIEVGDNVEILTNMSLFYLETDSNICSCDHCILNTRSKLSIKIKKYKKKIFKL